MEERFHRLSQGIFEFTVTIIDPQMCTKPWNALDKFPMPLQSADFDIREVLCSASEQAEYDKQVSRPIPPDSQKNSWLIGC